MLAFLLATVNQKYVWGAVGALIGAAGTVLSAWATGYMDLKKVREEQAGRIAELELEAKHARDDADREKSDARAAARHEQLVSLRVASSLLANALTDKNATGYRVDLEAAREAIASATGAVETEDPQLRQLIERLQKASSTEDKAEADAVSAALQAPDSPTTSA